MRDITANAAAQLAQNTGTELMVILEVEWVDNGSVFYSDQDIAGCQAKILEMGGFNSSMLLEGSSDTQELNIVLDDTDSSLRAIYNNNDIHKRPARVYLQHKGLTSADRVLIFKGELVSPISWDETQRSMSFSILSKLDSTQVGFSMEDGDFSNIPEEVLGKAWPLVFGQVCHLPAVKVRALRRGYLEAGEGIHDFTLDPRICQAMLLSCPSRSTGTMVTYTRIKDEGETEKSTLPTVGPDLTCVKRRFSEICRLQDLYEQQVAYESSELQIYNGQSFPQDTEVMIHVDGGIFSGTFDGNTFSVKARQHPEAATFAHQPCQSVKPLAYAHILSIPQYGGENATAVPGGLRAQQNEEGEWYLGGEALFALLDRYASWVPANDGIFWKPNQTDEQATAACDGALVQTVGQEGGPKEAWAYYQAMEESNFWWAPAGSEVYMEGEQEILYTVSLLPGTIDSVSAYRQASNGFRYLTEVPTDRYTVYETDYVGFQVVEIGLSKGLSHYIDPVTNESEGWEDQLYVSFTSSVGPNPCDIVEWLVNKYTNLTIDPVSFAAVKANLTNYPSNFYLLDRPNVYTLIRDIAYQSRCSVYVRNDTVYIKYLALEPTSVRTLTTSDISSGTFRESLSETEDIYTNHTVTWHKGGAAVRDDQSMERRLILKYNAKKYGTVEQEWNYYTYNLHDLVLKSATFWLIRKANSWRKISFQLPIKHIDLDVGDAVTINVPQFGDAVKVVIEEMAVNLSDNLIDVTCWSPIRAGETSPYFWAWPSQQVAHQTWPLAGDPNGGDGYNFRMTPPAGHLLLGGAHRDDQIMTTTGDLHPSDLDDVFPSPTCCVSDYFNFGEVPPAILAKEIAQATHQAALEKDTEDEAPRPPTSPDKEKEDPEQCGEPGKCVYALVIMWHKSTRQGQNLNNPAEGPEDTEGKCGGPCYCKGGCPSCTGPRWETCQVVSSGPRMANLAWQHSRRDLKTLGGYWECNETAPYGSYVQIFNEEGKKSVVDCSLTLEDLVADENSASLGYAP